MSVVEQLSGLVDYEEEFIESSRGVKLFTCRWLPADKEAKAVIRLCHGYGMECSIFMEDTGVRLAKAGYAVFGIDYEGHGKSARTRCYVKNFDDLVTDCTTFFRTVAVILQNALSIGRKRGSFISMGGAVALLIHRKQPNYWSGAVLVASMCKISEELKPHPLVINILKKLTAIIPTWKLVPTEDIVDVGFKEPEMRQKIRVNPYVYQGRPRLKTAYELLMISLDIEKRLDEVSLPFLIVHGEADIVTDPSVVCFCQKHRQDSETVPGYVAWIDIWRTSREYRIGILRHHCVVGQEKRTNRVPRKRPCREQYRFHRVRQNGSGKSTKGCEGQPLLVTD